MGIAHHRRADAGDMGVPVIFLRPEEVRELTGYAQAKRQVAYLKAERIPHRVNAAGWPLLRTDDVLRLFGVEPEGAPCVDATLPPAELPPAHVFQDIATIRARREVYTHVGIGPSCSGVYFLFLRWALLYVGQSVDIASRLRAHRIAVFLGTAKRPIPFNRFSFVEVPIEHLEAVELFYIRKLRPRMNVKSVPA